MGDGDRLRRLPLRRDVPVGVPGVAGGSARCGTVTGLEVRWRFFSLEEINRVEGKKHPWEREWSYGWSMMRIGALLRRKDPALLDAWYERAGRALHEEGRQPHRPRGGRGAARRARPRRPGVVAEAIADPTTHDDVRAEHDRVVAAGAFGVPTLFFPDGQCLFGPVARRPADGRRGRWRCGSTCSAGCASTRCTRSSARRRRPTWRCIAETFRPVPDGARVADDPEPDALTAP